MIPVFLYHAFGGVLLKVSFALPLEQILEREREKVENADVACSMSLQRNCTFPQLPSVWMGQRRVMSKKG